MAPWLADSTCTESTFDDDPSVKLSRRGKRAMQSRGEYEAGMDAARGLTLRPLPPKPGHHFARSHKMVPTRGRILRRGRGPAQMMT